MNWLHFILMIAFGLAGCLHLYGTGKGGGVIGLVVGVICFAAAFLFFSLSFGDERSDHE